MRISKLFRLSFMHFAFMISIQVHAQNDFDIVFDHEDGLKKFFIKPISSEDSDKFREKAPYVQSATLNLTLNLNGEIILMDFVEKSENESFNEMFSRRIRTTSGLWKIVNPPSGFDTFNLIVPFLQKTPPNDPTLYDQGLEEKYQLYHKSLTVDKVDGCEVSSCKVIPAISNLILPSSNGVR